MCGENQYTPVFCNVYHVHLEWRGVEMLGMNMADKDVVLRENLMFSDDSWLFPINYD